MSSSLTYLEPFVPPHPLIRAVSTLWYSTLEERLVYAHRFNFVHYVLHASGFSIWFERLPSVEVVRKFRMLCSLRLLRWSILLCRTLKLSVHLFSNVASTGYIVSDKRWMATATTHLNFKCNVHGILFISLTIHWYYWFAWAWTSRINNVSSISYLYTLLTI